MATALSNLSSYDPMAVPTGKGKRVAIVVSDWNSSVTHKLLKGATDTLLQFDVSADDIIIERVPGSFELVYAASQLAKFGHVNGIIIIGCVIRGDTPHFDYICQGVTQGITELNAKGDIPVIFGLLTVNNHEQAEERAGGRLGNKGEEFALTAIKMVDYAWKLQK